MYKKFFTLTIPFVLVSCSDGPSNKTGNPNDLPTVVSNDIQESLKIGQEDGSVKKGWYPKVTKVSSGNTEMFIVDYTDDPAYMTGPWFCGTSGCLLVIYAGSDGSFKNIWDNNVQGYKVDNPRDGSVRFDFDMRSWSCKNAGDGFKCTVKFKFDGNRMINTDGNFTES